MAVKTELGIESIQKLIGSYDLGLIDKILPLLKGKLKGKENFMARLGIVKVNK